MSTEPNEAPPDRFCDLVMKGGITSGVVYPPAICVLAKQYRFKNIGGTSAGAIAAAVTAAAEYRRRTTGSMAGFELLAALPDRLGTPDSSGKTELLRLFQADPPCRRLFGILVGSLNAGGTFRRIAAILIGCLTSYWPAALAAVALAVGVYFLSDSLWAAVLTLLLALPLLVGLNIYFDVTRNVVNNNYGFCKGLTTRPRDGAALTPWLHELIQQAAGLPSEKPLTFGDLWTAPGFPPPPAQRKDTTRSIDLEMFTTNLSHGRPYLFPHLEPTARLFFNEELAGYLPPDVFDWMNSKAIAYSQNTQSDPTETDAAKHGLKELPAAADFPVLLATRMSLSFPVLFAAVPLWAVDYEDPSKQRLFERCLFSDGGISSNFPVHLFDGLLPQWPTFGIKLEPALPKLPNSLIFLPHAYLQGIADGWVRFDQAQKPATRFGGFLTSIVGAMQNWNDNTVARMPGVRDRVVRLRLKDQEGGLNLNMEPALIKTIAERGRQAGEALVHRFATPEDGYAVGEDGRRPPKWPGWDSQRWVRLDVLMRTLADKSEGLFRSLGGDLWHATSYKDLLERAQTEVPPAHSKPLTSEQAQALDNLLEALKRASSEFEQSGPNYENIQTPNPDLRVRPSL